MRNRLTANCGIEAGAVFLNIHPTAIMDNPAGRPVKRCRTHRCALQLIQGNERTDPSLGDGSERPASLDALTGGASNLREPVAHARGGGKRRRSAA